LYRKIRTAGITPSWAIRYRWLRTHIIHVPVKAACTEDSTPVPVERSRSTIHCAWSCADGRSPIVTKRAAL
jgi:hypothetical protein